MVQYLFSVNLSIISWHPQPKPKNGKIFLDNRKSIPIWQTLEELSHPKPHTPTKTNNYIASVIANKTIVQQQTRVMDMILAGSWSNNAKQIIVYWRPEVKNLGKYSIKPHPPSHHIKLWQNFTVNILVFSMRYNFIVNTLAISNIQGCINYTNPVYASVSALTKLCATTFIHNTRTTYVTKSSK